MALRTSDSSKEETRGSAGSSPPGQTPAELLERIPTASQGEIDQSRARHTSSTPEKSGAFKPSETGGVYDPEKDELHDKERGTYGKELSSQALKEKEASASEETRAEGEEKSKLEEKEGYFSGSEKASRWTRLRGRFTRRRAVGVAVAATVGVGGFGLFGIVQGPLQFVHFAQNLQKFHLRSNEEFGDDRASKVLLYSLAGLGAERGRLGATSNKFADKWEQKLVETTGLRPVYNKNTGRFAGFEIVDENKARDLIDEWQNNGGKITRVGEAGGQGVRSTRSKNGSINNNARFLDARSDNPKARRALLANVGKSTGTYRVASVLGTRLLKKRGGVDFAPLKNKVRSYSDDRADKRAEKKKLLKESADRNRVGLDPVQQGQIRSIGQDADGNDITDPQAPDVAEDGKDAIDEASEKLGDIPDGETPSSVRLGIVRAANSAAVVGIMCSAKSFGNDIPKYKHEHIAMPVMRMGFQTISMGNQVMSGKNVNLAELEAFNDTLYDEETGTNVFAARSIQGELGKKQTGPDIPEEAQLKNINDKPVLFDLLDKVPGLDIACNISDAIFGLPGISQVAGAISSVVTGTADQVLGLFGTSVEKLTSQALAAASGNSVNLYAEGAEKGNLANLGAFMAGNDAAIAMGGDSLTRAQTAELKSHEKLYDLQDNENVSFYARYIDPYDSDTLLAHVIDSTPTSGQQVASTFANPLKYIASFVTSLGDTFIPDVGAQAAVGAYDYGVPKYGFTLGERNNTAYEDPYENAEYIEAADPNGGTRLENLNERYGDCFSMRIITDEEGVHLESGESVNVFKQLENDDCNKTEGDPDYNEYLRYRFYIADAVTAISLACNEGDENACAELSTGSGSDESSLRPSEVTGSGSVPQGSEADLAKKLLDYKNQGKYNCDNAMDCEDLEMTVRGQSIKGGVGCVADKLDKRVLQMLVYIIDNGYKVGTYALCRSHSYNQGAHPQGRGLDISSLNGKSLNSPSSRNDSLRVAKMIFDLKNDLAPRQIITGGVGATRRVDSEFIKYNRVEAGIEGQAAVNAFGGSTMAGHTDHIHVGY